MAYSIKYLQNSVILGHSRTGWNGFGSTRMAEVRGSSPFGSTLGNRSNTRNDRQTSQPCLTTVGATLGEYVLHRTRGMVSHPWNHVGTGVQCDRHGGVAQQFLDVLGVYITAQ